MVPAELTESPSHGSYFSHLGHPILLTSVSQPLAVANPNRVDPARAMDRLSRDGGIRYIIGNIMNSVSRSRYGKRLAQNSTREIHQAKNFSAATGMVSCSSRK